MAFNPDQLSWLHLIRDDIAISPSIEPDDFDDAPFSQREGIHPGRAMEREEIAASDWRERKRLERRAPTTCGCTAEDLRRKRSIANSPARE